MSISLNYSTDGRINHTQYCAPEDCRATGHVDGHGAVHLQLPGHTVSFANADSAQYAIGVLVDLVRQLDQRVA
jgi:hypothetical protein